jgi:amino-acid N-acetyltransferase
MANTHLVESSVSLRAATRRDWPAISGLLLDAQLPLDGAKESLGGFVVAIYDGDAVLGCFCIEQYGMTCLLRSLAVAAHARGCGLGRALMEEALRRIDAAGCASTILLTTTAAPFFLHFDFVAIRREAAPDVVKQSVEFSGACPISATVMQRVRPQCVLEESVSALAGG